MPHRTPITTGALTKRMYDPLQRVFLSMNYDTTELVEGLKRTHMQETGTGYVPEDPILQELPAMIEVSERFYGGMSDSPLCQLLSGQPALQTILLHALPNDGRILIQLHLQHRITEMAQRLPKLSEPTGYGIIGDSVRNYQGPLRHPSQKLIWVSKAIFSKSRF